ncbi:MULTISPECIES: protein-tyrosine-phosphatase [Flavobacteriaceae]|uniref:Protein-tyrosine-phosphatase n=2 Tax=Flavobacteriaceae TaxID=49546 RepID=A0A4Y8ARG9_9FLAO|nr:MULTISPECIES: protein-tyrosine-phosphatase [Flavobacteriaceae]TEW72601.1 protein-tyrosine-phosphatase [Gramella jeungdoensis]GGK54407.1 arsenate reductase [Lutibacter litoralis]
MLFQEIKNTFEALKDSPISEERKADLQPFVDYIQSKVSKGKNVNLNFICTHNSRRSHLSQVWAQAAAYYCNIKNVYCYSGGTEATAMFPMAVKALSVVGFQIMKISETENPVYSIKYAENEHPIIGFSKTYDSEFNPQGEFAALMTCSHADENCPVILGCESRIPVRYEDPKAFDNTPQQAEKYIERSNQIASEMLFVFSQIKK